MAEFNFEEFAKEWDEAHLEKDLGPSARTARCETCLSKAEEALADKDSRQAAGQELNLSCLCKSELAPGQISSAESLHSASAIPSFRTVGASMDDCVVSAKCRVPYSSADLLHNGSRLEKRETPSKFGESHPQEISCKAGFSDSASAIPSLRTVGASYGDCVVSANCSVPYSSTDLLHNDSRLENREAPTKLGESHFQKSISKAGFSDFASNSQRESTSRNNPPSFASTSGKVIVADSLAVTSPAQDEVPESFIKDLMRAWMDQIMQSRCSESSKVRDLNLIPGLPESLKVLRTFTLPLVLQLVQEWDPYLGEIRKVLKANAGSADNPLPRFFMQNGILCKKYMLKNSQREKHVTSLPNMLLAGTIHLLQTNSNHPTFTALERDFENRFHNRNACRMMKSYVKALASCRKVCC